jgi:hypothetical protein
MKYAARDRPGRQAFAAAGGIGILVWEDGAAWFGSDRSQDGFRFLCDLAADHPVGTSHKSRVLDAGAVKVLLGLLDPGGITGTRLHPDNNDAHTARTERLAARALEQLATTARGAEALHQLTTASAESSIKHPDSSIQR